MQGDRESERGQRKGEERERRKGDLQRFEIAFIHRDPDGVEVPLYRLSLLLAVITPHARY
jgi:hypothetical protein